jgi:hypothetical protein
MLPLPTVYGTRIVVFLGLLAFFVGCRSDPDAVRLQHLSAAELHIPTVERIVASASTTVPPAPKPKLVEPGRDTVRGHVLSFPPGFTTRDGAYDLVVHFHGNTEAVEESYALAHIDAAVVIINLGEGADRYEQRFSDPSRFSAILDRVQKKIAERGVQKPHMRRLALSAWSAGYGAVLRLIDQPVVQDRLDAVLLFDGMHARYEPGTETSRADRPSLAAGDVAPFLRLARRAVDDELLFFITHSRIQPENASLASVRETADVILDSLDIQRAKVSGVVKPRMLKAVEGIYARRSMLPMQALTVAIDHQLMVAEYDGRDPLDHVAHLLQMSQIGLPRLGLRWKNPKR